LRRQGSMSPYPMACCATAESKETCPGGVRPADLVFVPTPAC
jgi:hypothetical protein